MGVLGYDCRDPCQTLIGGMFSAMIDEIAVRHTGRKGDFGYDRTDHCKTMIGGVFWSVITKIIVKP